MKATLYRLYSDTGECLYVGITTTRMRRFFEHGRSKDWWTEVARIEIDHYESLEAVKEAERFEIRKLRPRENIEHRGRIPREQDGVVQLRKCRECGALYRLGARDWGQRITLCDECVAEDDARKRKAREEAS